MGDRPKQQKMPPESSTVDGRRVIADAIDRLGKAIQDAFGPTVEMKVVHDEFPLLANAVNHFKVMPRAAQPVVVKATPEEMDDPHLLEAVIRKEHPTFYETDGQKMKRLLSEVRARLLILSGHREEDQPTAGDVAQNELATERTDATMAFFDLAQGHSLPRKLLPRGDRTADWLPPGTHVLVLGLHPGVVAPEPDRVLVQVEGVAQPVSFPRNAVVEEGELWIPPKPTK